MADLVTYDKDFAEVQQHLRESAEKRRTQKTSPGIKKKRKIGVDRETGEPVIADTVNRVNYQVWLDEYFPGWSVAEAPSYSVDYVRDEQGRHYPVMINCDVLLKVVDSGLIRLIPGTGTCQMFRSEVTSEKDAVLKFKRTIAKTNAIKDACNWLYAFWDTRTNEDEREKLSQIPNDEHNIRFEELIKDLNESAKEVLRKKYETHSILTAGDFLNQLEAEIKSRTKANG